MAMIEQLDKAMVQGLFTKTDQPKESVVSDHRIKVFIDQS